MSSNAALETRRKAAVARGAAGKSVYVARAENAELWDVEGKRYIDMTVGIGVNNTGHRHPRVIAAVEAQLRDFTHTCFHVGPFEGYVRLCERLNAMVDTGSENRTLLVTTGAEAVENAVKIARAATGRYGVISFGGGFHGRTSMGMALTGKVAPYKRGFGPGPAGIFHAPFPNAYHGVSVDEALRGLDNVLHADIAPEEVAALLIEPVQGEGGFNVTPPEFLQALRKLADDHGIVLILDEVQAGMARTGRMLAVEHSGIRPDLVTMAKGLGGGFPIAAVTGRADIMDGPSGGGLGGTYAGNPLAVAAANAVLDVIADEGLMARATAIGATIRARLEKIAATNAGAGIGNIRGLGAMIAMELVTDRDSHAPDAGLATRIVAEAEKRGLLLLTCGTRYNVVRMLPPLTMPDAILSEALDILDQSVTAAVGAA
ncbi:4-aminobutyrate--2-oxoglutarate transaminase [Gemmobacter sp.]|uniref:4-aminobutyrate--2-oxoglutarate transaminase n=1 Tax=Gemmobacter sp. TaxID=1898957 RepID=UPI002AFEC4BD|nr:4-aminobutyrate--2-oxoglutarate transaminase [Gemmobacter sp.]